MAAVPERSGLRRLHLPARRVARSGSPARGHSRQLGDDQVLRLRAAGSSAPGEAQRAAESAYFSMPILGALAVLTGIAIWKPVQFAPLTEYSAATSGRATGTSSSMLGARGAHGGPRGDGVRGGPVLHSVDGHRWLRRIEVARGAKRAAVLLATTAQRRRAAEGGPTHEPPSLLHVRRRARSRPQRSARAIPSVRSRPRRCSNSPSARTRRSSDGCSATVRATA